MASEAYSSSPGVVTFDLGDQRRRGLVRRALTAAGLKVVPSSAPVDADVQILPADSPCERPETPALLLVGGSPVTRRPRFWVEQFIDEDATAEEIVARTEVLLGHRRFVSSTLEKGGITIDAATRTVRGASVEMRLGRTEFHLLSVLVARIGLTTSRTMIRSLLWPGSVGTPDSTINSFVRHLRRHLRESHLDLRIVTRRGSGLVLEVP